MKKSSLLKVDAKPVKPPHWVLAVTEVPRAFGEVMSIRAALPLLRKLPRGDGHGVMVIPGFMGDDKYNASLIRFLCDLGYVAQGWAQGRNTGPSVLEPERIGETLTALAAKSSDGTISSIGHSLGGIYAREIARKNPVPFRQVITLGSPFGGGRDSGSNASRFYQRINGKQQDTHSGVDKTHIDVPPPVKTTAIYTKGDGVVNWRTSLQGDLYPEVKDIRVRGSHCGLTLNPRVWRHIGVLLAKP